MSRIMITKEVEIELDDEDLKEIFEDMDSDAVLSVVEGFSNDETAKVLEGVFMDIIPKSTVAPIAGFLEHLSQLCTGGYDIECVEEMAETTRAILEHAMDANKKIEERLMFLRSKKEVAA